MLKFYTNIVFLIVLSKIRLDFIIVQECFILLNSHFEPF